MKECKKGKVGFIVMAVLVVALVFSIFYINFSMNPVCYNFDMFTDINYSESAWLTKSLFPENWNFGNQVYVVASPVLAALLFGLTGNHLLAMSLASSLMTLGVLASFIWMILPFSKSRNITCAGLLTFLMVTLFADNPIYSSKGWQLLFTMCSFYACYAICAFLAFGCYIRSAEKFGKREIALLVLTCLLSFGTGIQSFRQTAIMTLPLLAMEGICILVRLIQKQKVLTKSTLVTGTVSVSNILGVITFKLLHIQQHTIYGDISLKTPSEIKSKLLDPFLTAGALLRLNKFSVLTSNLLAIGVAMLGIVLIAVVVFLLRKKLEKQEWILLGLLFFGVAVIFAMEELLSMLVRPIYYFLLFPFLACFVVSVLNHIRPTGKAVLSGFLCCLTVACGLYAIYDSRIWIAKQEDYDELTEFVTEQNYKTVYANGAVGNLVCINSDWNTRAAFWMLDSRGLIIVDYLCDVRTLEEDPTTCAYVFQNEEERDVLLNLAQQKGIEMTLVRYIENEGAYVYTAPANLKQLFA